ncbi:MAG: TIM barrel protein [Capsulimonadales bacterium]|nr:TIM barrel protein [Capsulimonadales bacterium]
MSTILFTVFTKPYRSEIPDLARHIAGFGFDGVELPVRPGYPVRPENAETELPRAVKTFADFGLRIESIAGPTDERTIATCGAAGVPVIRICVSIRPDETYDEGVARLRREFDDALPHLERYGVTLGIQNHYGRDICHAMGLRHLLEPYDPTLVAAVWDAAHNALQGEEPELALDIVWPRLRMVNLKNAFWQRTNGPEAEVARWRPYWTSGRHGLASWPRVAASLRSREYSGVVCLTAEYDDGDRLDTLLAEDIAFARSLFHR